MPSQEFQIHSIDNERGDAEATLNKYGKEGWKLQGFEIWVTGAGARYILTRPLNEPSTPMEYKVQKYDNDAIAETKLNSLGKDGWTLLFFQIWVSGTGSTYVLGRELVR